MIHEIAHLDIKDGQEAEFEAAIAKAQAILVTAEGQLGHSLYRCMERPHHYALFIQWATLEAHTENFRGTDLFTQWRAILGPFFDGAPVVEHYEQIAGIGKQ